MRMATELPSIGLVLCLALAPACDDGSSAAAQFGACSAALPQGRAVPAGADGPAGAAACVEDGAAALATGSALRVPGYRTLGPPVLLRLDRPVPPHGVDLFLPFDPAQLPAGARARLAVLAAFGHGPAHVLLASDPAAGADRLRVHLPGHGLAPLAPMGALGDLGTFQVAVPEGLGQKVRRRLTYRAIGGVSMGGIGASINFFRHPERYDAIGVMGADPGPDLTYSQGFIRDLFFGGFCTAEDQKAGRGAIGKTCPVDRLRQPLAGQGEAAGDFEHMPIQSGNGIGLTLRRSLYLRANRDLVRALGNWAYHNPDGDPYLPPGVSAAWMAKDPAHACAEPVVLRGKDQGGATPFYDGRYNPEGSYDVITFCDGTDANGQPGVFGPAEAQKDPAQIFLSVDVNHNGRRDLGEPVILQTGEPYKDVGTDGLPDELEPGYDPVRNPDPSGDDYHYLKNPGGTEGNWRHDEGEPFDDVGLDGVAGTRGSPYDTGEGNGKYDLNPGLQAWLDHDPHTLAEKLPAEQLAQLDIYYDAGIRDFLNAHVSTNALMGVLAQRGLPVQVFDGFPALVGLGPDKDRLFNPRTVDLQVLGRRAYVRYGNPDLGPAQVEDTGDGRHVGTVQQAVNRAVLLFSFLLSRWPDGDLQLGSAGDPRLTPSGLVFAQKNGRQSPYGLLLPPGYFEPKNADLRYPIVYFGHGYGMKPEDLAGSTGSIIQSFMSEPDEKRRLPKAILVFVDAKCRPGGDVPQGPVPVQGDLCEEGAFYSNHPQGTYQGEDLLQELDDYLSKTYRVRAPAEVEVDR